MKIKSKIKNQNFQVIKNENISNSEGIKEKL